MVGALVTQFFGPLTMRLYCIFTTLSTAATIFYLFFLKSCWHLIFLLLHGTDKQKQMQI